MRVPLWELAQEAGPFVRLAGLSGAAAVVLGAMGAHRTFPETDTKEDLRKIFDTANRFHFLHTLALVTVPLCRRPYIVSIVIIIYFSFINCQIFRFESELLIQLTSNCDLFLQAGAFFIAGMGLFSGTCYYHAFTGDKSLRRLTPIGGSCLILGWIAMVL